MKHIFTEVRAERGKRLCLTPARLGLVQWLGRPRAELPLAPPCQGGSSSRTKIQGWERADRACCAAAPAPPEL